MAYTEVTRVEIIEVIRQWQAGRKIREIVRSTGIARNTIRKYLLGAQSCGVTRDERPPDEAQIFQDEEQSQLCTGIWRILTPANLNRVTESFLVSECDSKSRCSI